MYTVGQKMIEINIHIFYFCTYSNCKDRLPSKYAKSIGSRSRSHYRAITTTFRYI